MAHVVAPAVPAVNQIVSGDCVDVLSRQPANTFDCCVTSPPYWRLLDYGVKGQHGLEPSLDAWLAQMVDTFALVRRVLKKSGTLWLNLGDSWNSYGLPGGLDTRRQFRPPHPGHRGLRELTLKPKDLMGQAWRLAFALQAAGWYLRSEIIWEKRNGVRPAQGSADRPGAAHERLFMLTKRERRVYYHSPGPDDRSVWRLAVEQHPGDHPAVFPEELAARCIERGCPPGGSVLDPYSGSGTVPVAAKKSQRRYLGIELHDGYAASSRQRLADVMPLFDQQAALFA